MCSSDLQSAVGKLIRFAPHPGDEIPVLQHRQWVGVVGSLGQPRDGNPEACFAVFEPDTQTLTFHRVPYDHFAAAEKVADLNEIRVNHHSADR
mgnify:CR=1 FL=1